MKTRTFTNWNGTNPRRYVREEVADGLLEALRSIASGMGRDMLGTTSLTRDDMQSIAKGAIKKAEE